TALNYYGVVPDGPNITVEGIRTFDRGDGVAFGSNAPNWTLRGAYIHYARDGCVENHSVFAGTVDDALLDGCFIGFASRPYRAVQWQAKHPPALADVGPPVVSLFTPAANATLTGPITLTATAVDDRDLAEVRFQLDGQDLGAATTTDLTPTKYTLAWDSRGGAN